jgi:hypothetical protein
LRPRPLGVEVVAQPAVASGHLPLLVLVALHSGDLTATVYARRQSNREPPFRTWQ